MIHLFVHQAIDVCRFSDSTIEAQTSSRLMTQSEKYREARHTTQRIAEIVATFGTRKFRQAMKVVDRITHALAICDDDSLGNTCAVLEQQSKEALVAMAQSVQAGAQPPQDEVQPPQPELQSSQAELQSTQDEVQTTQDVVQSTQAKIQGTQDEVQYLQDETQSVQVQGQKAVPSIGNSQVSEWRGSDEDCVQRCSDNYFESSDSDELEETLAALDSHTSGRSRRPRVWSVSETAKPTGRPRRTLKQRQFARRNKFREMVALLQKYQPPIDEDSGNLMELQRRLDEEPVTYNALNGYLAKFSVFSNLPSPNEAPDVCVAVPARTSNNTAKPMKVCSVILPRNWVRHCLFFMDKFRREYREQQGTDLQDSEILLKFERGRNSLFPKTTGNYIVTMGGFHGARTGFGLIEDYLEWIRDIDIEGTQLGSIFGDVGVVTIEDISTCVGNINTCDGKEMSLLDLLHNEAEDIAMTAAISAMCADANSVAESAHSTTFTTQLMGLGTDEERLEWLKEHTVISSSGDKIVGALWLHKDHWCGIGISLKTYVFKIMDLRNNEATIDAIERIFRRTFFPLLPQEKRWRREISRFFQQLDGESCGVLVLAFIESYLFESLDIPSDTKLLRFHYMLKILLSGE